MNKQLAGLIFELLDSGSDIVIVGSGKNISFAQFETVQKAASKIEEETGLNTAIVNFLVTS